MYPKIFDISNYSKGVYIIRIATDDYDIYKNNFTVIIEKYIKLDI